MVTCAQIGGLENIYTGGLLHTQKNGCTTPWKQSLLFLGRTEINDELIDKKLVSVIKLYPFNKSFFTFQRERTEAPRLSSYDI